jgi:hypothetical protein
MELELTEVLGAARRAHFDAAGTACDYAALGVSRERGRLAACVAALESFDPKQVRLGAQTAFWLNVYNAALLRDVPELELCSGEREVRQFLERPRLKVARHSFSLYEIYHGLLRGNVPGPGRLRPPMERHDPRLAYMPIAYDERIHFAIYRACRSSPALRVFEGGKLDRQLEDATADYIRRQARVERNGGVVIAPRILQWYAKDFGGEASVPGFVLGFLDDEAVELADRFRGREKVRFADFDWALNRS